MFSVSIIVPSWHYFADPLKLQPLLELYFATVIDAHFKGEKVKVNIVDLRQYRKGQNKFELGKIDSYIPEQDLYLYWIDRTANYPELVSVVKELRRVYPKAKHAAGGTHIDNFPEESKKHFNAIILGPGEESFINIIKDSLNGSLKKTYKSDWRLVNYNDYPFARRHYLSKTAIANTATFEKYGGILGTTALFSRGCNFKCAYCIYNVPSTVQMRSPEKIEEEINYLKNEYKIEGVNLKDEMCIPLSEKIAIPFLKAIGRTNVVWRGQTRVGPSREMLTLARQTGCVELAVGVESASQQVLDIIRKGQTLQQVRDFIYDAKSVGIKIKMCLVLGLPGEPPNIVDMTRKFIEETQPDFVSVSGFCPIPGSEIFKNREYYGIKYIDEDWSKHAHLLFRFSDQEHFGLPFEYEKTNRWGKTFSRPEILNNIRELQHYLQERNKLY